MSEEIKEVLDYLKDDKVIYGTFGTEYKKVDLDEIKLLLDYITNLEYRINKTIEFINTPKELDKSLAYSAVVSKILKILEDEE